MPDTLPFGKDRKPDYPDTVERKPLSKFDFATLFLKQGGKCAKCGAELKPGKIRDEHLHALHRGGDNSLSNRALWCLPCTKPKDREDKAAIAKSKRIRGETCNGPSRPIPQPKVSPLSKHSPHYRPRSWGKKIERKA